MTDHLADQAKDLVIEVDRAIEHVEDMCRVASYNNARWLDTCEALENALEQLRNARHALGNVIDAHDGPPF